MKKEILELRVMWGEAGDLIPADWFFGAVWQSPNYNTEKGCDMPDLVNERGLPLRIVPLAEKSGEVFAYAITDNESVMPLTWETLGDNSTVAYGRLRQAWFGFSDVQVFPSDGYLSHNLDDWGAASLFELLGCLDGFQEEILALAKTTTYGKTVSVALLINVIPNRATSYGDYDEEQEPTIELLGLLDFSSLKRREKA